MSNVRELRPGVLAAGRRSSSGDTPPVPRSRAVSVTIERADGSVTEFTGPPLLDLPAAVVQELAGQLWDLDAAASLRTGTGTEVMIYEAVVMRGAGTALVLADRRMAARLCEASDGTQRVAPS